MARYLWPYINTANIAYLILVYLNTRNRTCIQYFFCETNKNNFFILRNDKVHITILLFELKIIMGIIYNYIA